MKKYRLRQNTATMLEGYQAWVDEPGDHIFQPAQGRNHNLVNIYFFTVDGTKLPAHASVPKEVIENNPEHWELLLD